MLRLAFIPIFLLVFLVLSIIFFWIAYKKVKKGIGYTLKRSSELVTDQKQKWTEKEQRKQYPEILLKGFIDYDKITMVSTTLPNEWISATAPVISIAKEILDEVTLEFEQKDEGGHSNKNKAKLNEQNKKLNSIRPFFIHSLDALLQLIKKLSSDYQKMNTDEIEKARQNITVLRADLLSHQETLHEVRRFDFDVTMDVIKARLK